MNILFGFPGYWATEDGRIWSSPRERTKGGFLKQSPNPVNGYLKVNIHRNGKKVTRTVHSLVARSFLGNPPPGMEVRHLDGDVSHNGVRNLKYGTKRENQLDRVAHGRNHNAIKTHCPANHEYTPENTRRPASGGRYCRQCQRDRRRPPIA